MIGNTYLKLKLLKRKIPLKALSGSYIPIKGTRKVKDFQKISTNKEIYFTLQSNK